MSLESFLEIVDIIEKNLPKESPLNQLKNSYKRNPYTILMATLLSLRSKDEKTATVTSKLFNHIQTPQELLDIPQERLEEIIKPIGFHKKKAKTLIEVSKILVDKYNSKVPKEKKELLSIKGIGEKSANVVLNSAFGIPIIAVDTHVHRLCNMWGVVKTKSDIETSKVLNKIVPKEYKSKINTILVAFGQTICKVNNPQCDKCPILDRCKRVNNCVII